MPGGVRRKGTESARTRFFAISGGIMAQSKRKGGGKKSPRSKSSSKTEPEDKTAKFAEAVGENREKEPSLEKGRPKDTGRLGA